MKQNMMLLNPYEQLLVALGQEEKVVSVVDHSYDTQQVSKSVASVITYIVTDAFNLSQEESFWVGYELSSVLSPISVLRPRVYLAAVKHELETGHYSQEMFSRDWDHSETLKDSSSKQAVISDWVEMFSEVVLVSYPDLRSLLQASIVGSIYGILTELGLTDNINTTRKSIYLPNTIRHLIGLQE